MPKRTRGEEEDEEDCLGVVCDTGNAMKKKGGPLTTTTGEVNLYGPDDLGGIPKQNEAELRKKHKKEATQLRERQEQEAAARELEREILP